MNHKNSKNNENVDTFLNNNQLLIVSNKVANRKQVFNQISLSKIYCQKSRRREEGPYEQDAREPRAIASPISKLVNPFKESALDSWYYILQM